MEAQKYWPPYAVGVMLGLVLLSAYFFSGRGLGASGAVKRTVAYVEMKAAPSYVENNHFLSHYAHGKHSPLRNWLVFEVLGVMVGGLISGALAGRSKWTIERGPRFSDKKRLLFAFIGGSLMGFGAALGRGCTSGQALSGGATLAVGSWAFMLMVFAGGYMLAYFMRKQWI
ncbi:MAG: YeeE/YedE family protein [Calditrichaeota bacterium]|nr:YeeE/YedE family protein [Calditrichota bacterium]